VQAGVGIARQSAFVGSKEVAFLAIIA